MYNVDIETFELVLILLSVVVLSSIIRQFVHVFSLVGIQIMLGFTFAILVPEVRDLTLEPSLFFCLFVAPLLFLDAKTSAKRELFKQKYHIAFLAFGLVFLTVLLVGGTLSVVLPYLMPSVIFAGVACLAPTDAVAVKAAQKKARIPHRLMHILEGEALINDASGIVSFQFAIGITLLGGFSNIGHGALDFSLKFLYVLLGGVAVGVTMTVVKLLAVHTLRRLGLESAVLHTLVEILTPFLIYLVAEKCEVSGIISVVASGLMHTVASRYINPESARLTLQSIATWDMLSFCLNGIIFVLLGSQIPHIFEVIMREDTSDIVSTTLLAVALTAGVALIRFCFVYLQQVIANTDSTNKTKLTNALIMSLSGVRGAVALATAMSLPYTLSDGTPFPEREHIIYVVALVIIFTLLLANFVLPPISRRSSEASDHEPHTQSVELEIVKKVIKALQKEERFNAELLNVVVSEYMNRLKKLQAQVNSGRFATSTLQFQVLLWQKRCAKGHAEEGKASYALVQRYVHEINKTLLHCTKDKQKRKEIRQENKELSLLRAKHKDSEHISREETHRQFEELTKGMNAYVLKRLNQLSNSCEIPKDLDKQHITKGSTREEVDTEELQILIDEYELRVQSTPTSHNRIRKNVQEVHEEYQEIAILALAFERDEIALQYEKKNITHAKMRELRQNVDLMEFAISPSSE